MFSFIFELHGSHQDRHGMTHAFPTRRSAVRLTTDHELMVQLEIHEFRIAGPLDVRPCSDDREAVALVVDWLPIPDWRDGRGCAAVAAAPVTLGNGLSNMLLVNHAIAKFSRLRERGEQFDVSEAKPAGSLCDHAFCLRPVSVSRVDHVLKCSVMKA